MALENEVDQVMSRLPGGAQVGAGSYVNFNKMCIFQTTSDTTLPNTLDWWHFIPTATAGNESLATCATKINTALNALSPIAGNYAYVAANFHAYTSGDAMQQKGTGAVDA